jgi:DNA ligase (NAD+)
MLLLGLARWAGGGMLAAGEQTGRDNDRMRELQAEIALHDEFYFRRNEAEISDAEYDRLKRELRALEAQYPEAPRSPRQVGDDRSGELPTASHRVAMQSLDKTYTQAEWREFHGGVSRRIGRADAAWVVEPKYDGVAVSLTYEHGRLIRALTRGNEAEGDEVTAGVRSIPNVPAELHGGTLPALVELRGEVYLEHAEFARINAARAAAGEETFAHPRNLAAGTLKAGDRGSVGGRRLSLVIHGWGAWEGTALPVSHEAFQAQVRLWGLPAVTRSRLVHSAEQAWLEVTALERERTSVGFPIDGAVVKLNEVSLRTLTGAGETAPRWAVACKFEPERAVTRLRAITIQVGRTGLLTPVAEFDAVDLGGAIVSRATLHNRAVIARRDIRVGDLIQVERTGEVIPAVVGVLKARRAPGTRPYAFPDRCPACAAPVLVRPDVVAVHCPNLRCSAQRQRRLEHFASTSAVAITGLGPATVQSLLRSGLVQSASDLYRLRATDLAVVDGIGALTADRLVAAIDRSRDVELWRFLYGLGIPEVGPVTARAIAARCRDLADFTRLDRRAIAGAVDPAAAESLVAFLSRSESRAEFQAFLSLGVNPRAKPSDRGSKLRGKIVVFTGRIPGMTREEAARAVRAAGGEVRIAVSARTDYLVAGDGAGTALADARRWGVDIIEPREFKRLVGGD